MTETEEKTIWKVDKISINHLASIKTYNKIICYWIRTNYDPNTKLSDDIINFVAKYLSISISYSTKWSDKYKSECIKVLNDGNAFLLKDHIDKSSFGVIRCEKELQHGMITEYKVKLRTSDSDLDNIFIHGIVNDKFNDYNLYKNNGKTIRNFWGFMDQTLHHPNSNIYKGYLDEELKGYYLASSLSPSSYFKRSSNIFREITVRVNLNDYLLSFWDGSMYYHAKEAPICFFDHFHNGNPIGRRGCMSTRYWPIVFDLPKDKSFKWYPAIFINKKQDTPVSIQFID